LEYLPKAVDSVLSQEMENGAEFELIVVDDGSTDKTWKWLERLAKNDSRVVSIRLSGLGPSKARNAGISASRGEFIAFLDADDIWLPGKLLYQLKLHRKNPDIIMSFTDYKHVNPKGDDLGNCFNYWPRFSKISNIAPFFYVLDKQGAAILFAENVVGTSTVMMRHNALQNADNSLQIETVFDEHLRSAEDWDLWLRLALCGSIGFINQPLAIYLMRPGSESGDVPMRLQTMEQLINRYEAVVQRLNPKAVLLAQGRLATGFAEYYRSTKHPVKALLEHLKALWLAPSLRITKAVATDMVNLGKEVLGGASSK
jgi:GT2 family glycosyltransferase